MQRLKFRISELSRSFFLSLLAVAVVYGLLFFSLGQLVPGLAAEEVAAAQSSRTFQSIIDNPLYLPHKLGQYLVQRLDIANDLFLRSVSAVSGMLIVFVFYFALKQWQTSRIAILGTLLFAASGWFLHVARFASSDVLYLLPIALMAYGIWVQKTRYYELSLCLGAGLLVGILFVPGLVWFGLPLIIWQRRRLRQLFARTGLIWRILALTAAGSGLVVLGQSLIRQPELIPTWLGLPETWPSITGYLQNILAVPYSIFVGSAAGPALGIDGLPLLDIFASVMFAVGLYAFSFRLRLDRTRFLVVYFVLGTALIALDGPVSLALLLPAVYIVVAAGITLMLQQWFTVFPRNPLARSVGSSLITIAVLVTSYYHINQYFIAWPNAPETKAVFTHQLRN